MTYLAELSSFEENDLRMFKVDGKSVCAVNVGGTIKAFKNRCAHQNMPLHTGMIKDNWIVCSFHGWLFDMDSGECGVNPSCTLPIYKVTIEDDKVYVEFP